MKSDGSDDAGLAFEKLKNEINENPDAFNNLPDEVLVNIFDQVADNYSNLKALRLINKRFKHVVDNFLLGNQIWVKQKLQMYPFNDAVSLANLVLDIQLKEPDEKKDDPYQTLLQHYAHSRTYVKAMEYLFTLPQSQALQYVQLIRGSSLYLKPLTQEKGVDDTAVRKKQIIQTLFYVLFAANLQSERMDPEGLMQAISLAEKDKLLSDPCLNSLRLTALTLDDELYQTEINLWRNTINTLTKTPLSYVNASGAVLAGLDLSKLNLSGFNFNEADLERTDFTDSNLSFCNLTDAKLMAATLVRSDLSHAILTKVNLNGAHIPLTNLTNADLTMTTFSGAMCVYQKKEDRSLQCDFIINLDHPELPRIIEETKEALRVHSQFPKHITEAFLKSGIYERYENYKAQPAVSTGKSGLFGQSSKTTEKSPTNSPKTPRVK